MRTRNLALVLIALVGTSACIDRPQPDVLAEDSTLARDLALANADTVSVPQLADVPVVEEPVATGNPRGDDPRPAPARARAPRPPSPRPAATRAPVSAPSEEVLAAPRITASGNIESPGVAGTEREPGIVSTGSQISLASTQRVCTSTSKVGDTFTARLSDPVIGANGAVIPVGATALVSVTSLKSSDKAGDEIEVGLRVVSITFGGRTYPVESETTFADVERVRLESRSDDLKKVAAGAAIGAVVGRVLGGKTKSTVIGAATGAAAGAAVASRNANYEGCVPSGGRITIRLTGPLTLVS